MFGQYPQGNFPWGGGFAPSLPERPKWPVVDQPPVKKPQQDEDVEMEEAADERVAQVEKMLAADPATSALRGPERRAVALIRLEEQDKKEAERLKKEEEKKKEELDKKLKLIDAGSSRKRKLDEMSTQVDDLATRLSEAREEERKFREETLDGEETLPGVKAARDAALAPLKTRKIDLDKKKARRESELIELIGYDKAVEQVRFELEDEKAALKNDHNKVVTEHKKKITEAEKSLDQKKNRVEVLEKEFEAAQAAKSDLAAEQTGFEDSRVVKAEWLTTS